MKLFLTAALIAIPFCLSLFESSLQLVTVGLFLSVVVLWFTELLPLPVTALFIPAAAALLGLLPAKEAFQAFGSDILFLFLGCFLLAKAMQKHGWDKRMSYFVLSTRLGEQTPALLIAATTFMSWALSMWISNTATCAMMTPICLAIVAAYRESLPTQASEANFQTRILLCCAFGSTIGGLATPVGTPPNLMAVQFMKEHGITVSFLDWLLLGLPISLLMLAVLLVAFAFLFPLTCSQDVSVRAQFKESLSRLGVISREELLIFAVFLGTVVCWILPDILNSVFPETSWVDYLSKRLTLSVVGISAGITLFLLPATGGGKILQWSDTAEIDWGTLMLFGGGLTLGTLLSETGVAATLGSFVFHSQTNFLLILLLTVCSAIILSELGSNTASAAIILPIAIASVSEFFGTSAALTGIIYACAFGASFGFILPVSTPPNAIVFGTGLIKLKDMIRAGIFFDLIGAVAIWGTLALSF